MQGLLLFKNKKVYPKQFVSESTRTEPGPVYLCPLRQNYVQESLLKWPILVAVVLGNAV